MFNDSEADSVTIRKNGAYREVPLARDLYGRLYAKLGTTYAQLRSDGSTSVSGVMVVHMATDKDVGVASFGRLVDCVLWRGNVDVFSITELNTKFRS